MAQATLNKNQLATKADDMAVYNYDGTTREYLSESVAYLTVGMGFLSIYTPENSKENYAICRTAVFRCGNTLPIIEVKRCTTLKPGKRLAYPCRVIIRKVLPSWHQPRHRLVPVVSINASLEYLKRNVQYSGRIPEFYAMIA